MEISQRQERGNTVTTTKSPYTEQGKGPYPTQSRVRDLSQNCKGTDSKINLHVVFTSADGHRDTLPCQLVFQGKTEKALPSNMKYKKSTVAPVAGGKKKEREEAADTGKSSKMSHMIIGQVSPCGRGQCCSTPRSCCSCCNHTHARCSCCC